jgi:hypothetical protein
MLVKAGTKNSQADYLVLPSNSIINSSTTAGRLDVGDGALAHFLKTRYPKSWNSVELPRTNLASPSHAVMSRDQCLAIAVTTSSTIDNVEGEGREVQCRASRGSHCVVR